MCAEESEEEREGDGDPPEDEDGTERRNFNGEEEVTSSFDERFLL